MPLQKEYKEFPLLLGIDSKTDPFQLQIGQLSTSENVVYTTPKQTRKRTGYIEIGNSVEGGGTISNPQFISTFQNQEIQGSTTTLYSFADGTQKWTQKGSIVSATTSNIQVDSETQDNNSDLNQDGAYSTSNGLFLSCWQNVSTDDGTSFNQDGCYYSIVDYTTGEIIAPRVQLSSSVATVNPKAFQVGQHFFVFYVDENVLPNTLYLVTIPVTAPLSPNSPVVVSADLKAANPFYDICVIGSTLYIAYSTNAAGTGVGLRKTDDSLVISGETQIAGENASNCISIVPDIDNSRLWVSYENGTNVKAFCVDTSFTTVVNPLVVEATNDVRNLTGFVSGGTLNLYYEQYDTDSNFAQGFSIDVRLNTVTSSGSVGTPSTWTCGVGLISKFFTYNSTKYVVVSFQSIVQATYFVLNTSGKVVAKILPGSAGGFTNQVDSSTSTSSTLCEVNTISTGIFGFSLLQQKAAQYFRKFTGTTADTFATGTVFGTVFNTIDFTDSTYQNVDIANGLMLVGGAPFLYDGVTVTEHGFYLFPEIPVLVATGSGHLSDGAYSYRVCYEWTDNFGQVHRSAPSQAKSITLSGGGSSQAITVHVQDLFSTLKPGVTIVLYRTNQNGSTYYRVPIMKQNTIPQTTESILDNSAADLSGYQELYTNSGEVENIQLPSTNLMTTYKTRVIAVPTESQSSFWFSKEIVPNSPVEFHDEFVWNITTQDGAVTGIRQMDSNLIIFKTNTIWVMSGDGPALNGTQNDFNNPQRVPSDVGLPSENANSMVLTPVGIMFQSSKGIYLLDRSLNVSYIGAPVEAYNSYMVTSAVLLQDKREIRFTTSGLVALVYNYFTQQWSTFTNISAISATEWDGTYTYLSSSNVFQESTSFDDNGSFIKKKLVTGWLNFSGVQGFERIYKIFLLGVWRSPHTLIVNLYRDYDPNPFQTSYITASSAVMQGSVYGADSPYGSGTPYGGEYNGLYQWLVRPSIQKVEALQISIEDSQDTTYGEGYSLSSIGFIMGIKQGGMKLPATRKIG